MSRHPAAGDVTVPNAQPEPMTPAVRSILRYCASGYVAGQHWNERVFSAWSVEDIAAACHTVEAACRPGNDPALVLDGLRALAEMLQVELPGPFGLDLMVEELVLLPRDLLEDAIRALARTFSYRRFPVLAEIRGTVAEEIARRSALARSVRALARDCARRRGIDARALPVSVEAGRGGGLRPVSACMPRRAIGGAG